MSPDDLHLHDVYLPVAVDYDCCGHCNAISGGYVPWPCPPVRAEKAEAKVAQMRAELARLMDILTNTADGLGDWHDATEYVEWTREKVREIYVRAAAEGDQK